MRKTIAALATAAALLGGFGAAVIIQSPTAANAQEDGPEATEVELAVPLWIDETLSDLVDEGVVTREQADRVGAALSERLGDVRGRHGRGLHLEAAAAAIGIDVEDLVTALREGQSIAQVATANGVSRQTVIDALVAGMNDRLDQAVEDGKLTAERADEIRAEARDRITAMVNGEGGPIGFGPGFHRHHRWEAGPPTDDAPDASGAGA